MRHFEKSASKASKLNASIELFFERYGPWMVALAILCFFVFHSLFIYPRHVWFDEIVTYSVSRTFSWASVTEAIRLTADAQPPTYHLFQMPVLSLFGDDPRHLRWLTLLAASVALGAVFVWLRRMTSTSAALAGFAALAGSKLSFYSIEARPYALLIGTSAVALACRRLPWRVLWLAAAVSVHYYGVFVPAALALTERSWRRRLAYGTAYLPLLITMPALHPPHLLTAGTDWEPTVLALLKTLPVLAGASLYSLAALFVAGIFLWVRLDQRELWRGRWILADRASWALVAIAPACWLMGEWFTGIFCMRYAIVALLGLIGLVAWFVHYLPYRAIVTTVFCVLCLTVSLSTQRLLTMESWDPRPTARLIDQTLATYRQPIVMGERAFLDIHHYVSPENRGRFQRVTIERPSFTTEYAYQPGPGQNTRWSEMIGKYAGFTPLSLDDWLEGHSSFIILVSRESDWVLKACRQRGARLTLIGRGELHEFYAVRTLVNIATR